MSGAHIGMVADICDANTGLRVSIEDLLNKVFALRGQELGHLIVSGHNLFVQIRSLWILEGKITCDHGVKDDTTRPNIGLEAVVSFTSDHFGCGVARRTTRRLKSFTLLIHVR